jgi:hypothetical protein
VIILRDYAAWSATTNICQATHSRYEIESRTDPEMFHRQMSIRNSSEINTKKSEAAGMPDQALSTQFALFEQFSGA